MKSFLTLFLFSITFGITSAQIMIDNPPMDGGPAPCEGGLPGDNSAFMTWLDTNGGGVASSDCGSIDPDPWNSDYDPDNWQDNGCTIDITVTFTVEDDCSSPPETLAPVTFSLNDSDGPQFVSTPPDMTFECDGTGNATDIQDHIDAYVNGLSTGDLTDDCSSSDDVIASIMHDGAGAAGTMFGCTEDITITFTITDNCGMTETATMIITIDDTMGPTVDNPIDDLTFECDMATNASTIDDWINNRPGLMVTEGCSSVADITPEWDGTIPECGSSITINFIITDECGTETTTSGTVTIVDTTPPDLPAIANPAVIQCDEAQNEALAQEAIDRIVDNLLPSLTDNCVDGSELMFNPDPTVSGPPSPTGSCTYEYVVTFTLEDPCGNPSVPQDVTISFEDTTPPEFEVPFPTDESYPCFSDAPPLSNLATIDVCEGVGVADGIEDTSQLLCDGQGIVTREYILEDACGNPHPDNPFTQTLTIGDPAGVAITWIDESSTLPGQSDISFQLNSVECDNPYNFMDCAWIADPSDPSSQTWPFPLVEGTHFESNSPCGNLMWTSTEMPCSIDLGGGSVEVTYTVTDDCGNSLEYSFTVDVDCSSCSGGTGNVCEDCESSSPGSACNTCDINELAGGVSGCNPPWEGGIQSGQPSPLCGGGVPNNMSWFSFTAGSSEIDVSVCPNSCIPGENGFSGIQAGIYDGCGGSCLSGDDSCPPGDPCKDFSLSGMVVGNTYYVFVDGCAGSECQWDITITGQAAYVIDNMESVVVESDCTPLIPGQYCPGQMVAFNVNHAGDSPSDNGSFDGPGPYDPSSDLCFDWSSSPGLDGYNDVVSQGDNGAPGPMVELPFVSVPTTYTICIEDVYGPCEDACDDGDCVGDCCLDIVIAPYDDEPYEFDVCYEDLQQGWDPSEAIALRGGLVGWEGGLIGLSDVGREVCAEAIDPQCGCNFFQKVTVNIVGEEFKEPYTFFMYDCQFKDLEGNFDDYEWIHPETFQEEIIPYNAPQGLCIYLVELSEDEDWNRTRCDFPIEVSVQTTEVLDILTPGPCTPNGTEYCWALDLDGVDDDWPEIDPNYMVEWVLCDDPEGSAVSTGDCFSITTVTAGEYCVRVTYSFFNSEYPDGGPELNGSCSELFGPHMLDSDVASPPIIDGVTEFCANDLMDKEFSIDVPAGSTDTYTWSVAGTGAVITTQSANGAEITFDLTGYDFSQPITVDANTACGESRETLNLTSIPIPTPEIGAIDDICLTGGVASVSEIFYGAGSAEIAEYIWTPSNNNSATVDFAAATEGQQDIMLTVVDVNGCMSDPVSASYLVVAPLDDPQVQCGNLTDSSVEFVWNDIPSATGYIVDVTGAATFSDANYQTTSYEATGLNVNETVFISVTAIGNPPCGNSATVTRECETTDCPAPLTTIPQNGSDQICTNDAATTFTFDLDGSIMDSDGRFDVILGPDPAATYYDQATGTVDPTGLPAGEYTISSRYFYNNDACDRQGPTYTLTVNPEPNVDFTTDRVEICVGESVVIDDSMVDAVATFDYGMDGSRDGNDNVTWTSAGTKTITVDVMTPEGCMGSTSRTVTVQDSLMLGAITCTGSGLDFVSFDWDDVTGADDYTITYIVNTNPSEEITVTDSEVTFDMLPAGAFVQVSVVANAGAGFCGTVASTGSCAASDCPEVDFTFDSGPFCFGAISAGIDLNVVAVDPASGDELTGGMFMWDDAEVVDGIFTPVTTIGNQDYNLSFTYLDMDGCGTPFGITIPVLAEPAPVIADIDGFCVNGMGEVSITNSFINGEEILWEWDGNGSAMGEGPHSIGFADGNMIYEVTVTVTNGIDGNGDACTSVATASVLVDEELVAPMISCNSNNTGVFFTWNDVTNADMYEISVDGTVVGTQTETNYDILANPGESFTIEVTAISNNNCSDVSDTFTCEATNCAPSVFADIDNVTLCIEDNMMPIQFTADLLNPPMEAVVVPGAWSGTGISSDGLFDPNGIPAEDNIQLTYSIEYPQDCIYTTDVFVSLQAAPSVSVDPMQPDCFQDSPQAGTVEVDATGGTPPYTYTIEGFPPQDVPSFVDVLTPGSYNGAVTDANGCATSFQLDIVAAVEPPLGIDGPTTILAGANGEYSISEFPSDIMIGDVIWLVNGTDTIPNDPDGNPISISATDYPQGFDLTVTVIFNNDCFQETGIRVDVVTNQRWYIPNVISTSGMVIDDIDNSKWQMFISGGDISVQDLRVYDRWGELVHQLDINSSDPEIDLQWSGIWTDDDGQGDDVIQGVYVYVINMTVAGRKIVEAGDITIVR